MSAALDLSQAAHERTRTTLEELAERRAVAARL
jgi:hypothetical protein